MNCYTRPCNDRFMLRPVIEIVGVIIIAQQYNCREKLAE